MRKQLSNVSKKVYSICDVDISKEKQEQMKEYFMKRKDQNEYISLYNAVITMKELGLSIDEKKKFEIIQFLDKDKIKWDMMKKLFVFLNHKGESKGVVANTKKDDYSDAFVAVGGSPDLEGYISIKDMIETFENFKIEACIKSLLEKNGFANETRLDFEKFCKLFNDNTASDDKDSENSVSQVSYLINNLGPK